MTRRTRTRRGATLVEMLVAAAMSIMIMWLLTWCYQQGLASFSNTKSHADLMDQERMVTSIMTRDLLADHFLTEDNKPNGGRMVRDQWLYAAGYTPPKYGFFYAYSLGPTPTEQPGVDPDGFTSTISTDHILQFSAILPGGPSEQLFSADVPFATPAPMFGRAAEISYYLVPAGRTLGGTQLYNLIRRQRLCALTTDDKPTYDQKLAATSATPADAIEVMAVSNTNPPRIYTLNDLTNPAARLFVPVTPVAAHPQITYVPRLGEDILMSNVVSFEVKFTGVGTSWPRPLSVNLDYPYDNLPANGSYDTAAPAGSAKVRITGVQIRLRAHDPKSRTTRQTTATINL